MKILLVLVCGLAAAQMESSWIDDFDPESAYLSIISVRKDFEAVNETRTLDDEMEDLLSSDESEDAMPPPPSPPPSAPGRGRRPRPPGPPGPPRPSEGCGAWGPWEQAKCFWPDQSLDKLPKSCVAIPTKPEWPSWMKKFVASKTMEKYNMLMDEYKARGAPPKCGFCARSFECRIRNDTTTSKRFCPMKEVRPMFETDCDDKKACEVSQEKGGCPPPLFLGGGRKERLQMMIRNGNHEGFSNELYKMRMMDDASQGGRQKRQADFSDFVAFDDSSAASFMPFEPQFDFPYEGRAEGRDTNKAGPMGYAPNTDNYDGFREGRRGQQSGRGRGDKRKKGGRGEGRRGEGRGDGRRGRPDERPSNDFFGPAADMPRFGQPFGRMPSPPGSGVRPPFFHSDFPSGPVPQEPFGQGAFPSGQHGGPPPSEMQFPPRQQFGPGPSQPPFGGFPQRHPFGAGPSFRPPFGPGPNQPSFGPGPSASSFGPGPNPPPFGRGPNPPSFGPGPFNPSSFGSGPNPPPFGAGPSNDAPFPFFGNMGDGRGPRGGRQAPYFNERPNSFQPRQQYGPGMSAAPLFSMFLNNRGRGMSFPNDAPMWFRRPFGPPPPPPHHRFLMELFHGTTCASNGKSCLCCCGHYIPNVETGACEDLKQLLPGIDKMVDNVDKENQKQPTRPQSPPDFRQMRQMKKMSKKFDDF